MKIKGGFLFMRCRNYGVYEQGAIIKYEDFDPIKVILAVCEKICEIVLPQHIKNALTNKCFDYEVAVNLCELLKIKFNNPDGIQDYSCIFYQLIKEACLKEWFDEYNLMGSNEVFVTVINEIEGEFVYDNQAHDEDYVEDILMFSLRFPLIWDIKSCDNWKSKEEIIRDANTALQEYWEAAPSRKNQLLKTIIRRIYYFKTKEQRDNDFEIRIEFQHDM